MEVEDNVFTLDVAQARIDDLHREAAAARLAGLTARSTRRRIRRRGH